MIRNGWTIIFLRGDAGAQAQCTLSARKARVLFWGLCVAGVLVVAAAPLVVVSGGLRIRAAQLSRENEEMKGRLAQVQGQVEDLDRRVAAYDEQNERLRRTAGLEGIDQEVYDVGVGGPGPVPASDVALAPFGRQVTRGYLDFLQRKVALLEESSGETMAALEASSERINSVPSIMPVWANPSSGFGPRRAPVHGGSTYHRGVDIPGVPGERIVATAHGRVTFTGRKKGLGLTVTIDHGHGLQTVYGHASEILVERGQQVERRDVIALVGNTGTSTGYHVHYEVHVDGVAVDPTRFFFSRTPS